MTMANGSGQAIHPMFLVKSRRFRICQLPYDGKNKNNASGEYQASQSIPKQKIEVANARERWNDYGIGLLLQGDLRAAQNAFL